MNDYIKELQRTRAERLRAERREKELLTPLLSLGEVAWLRGLVKDRDTFIIIALRMLSPGVFVGDRIKNRVRFAVAKEAGVFGGYLSHLTKDLLFRYSNISAFRDRVDAAYYDVLDKLSIKSCKH